MFRGIISFLLPSVDRTMQYPDNKPVQFKVILLGESGVGKTTLYNRYQAVDKHSHTTSSCHCSREFPVGPKGLPVEVIILRSHHKVIKYRNVCCPVQRSYHHMRYTPVRNPKPSRFEVARRWVSQNTSVFCLKITAARLSIQYLISAQSSHSKRYSSGRCNVLPQRENYPSLLM